MPFPFHIFSAGGGTLSVNGIGKYPNAAALPGSAADGDVAIVLDTNNLYSYDSGVGGWVIIGGPGVAVTVADTDSIDTIFTLNTISSALRIPPGITGVPTGFNGVTLQVYSGASPGLVANLKSYPVYGQTSGVWNFTGSTYPVLGGTLVIDVVPASGSNSGLINTDNQSFGGDKFFNNIVVGWSGFGIPKPGGPQTIYLNGPTTLPSSYNLYLPSTVGTTYSMWLANGLGGVTLSQLGNLTNIQSKNMVYVDAVNYLTVQAAVTYAESLAASATKPGVCVVVPAGIFNETVTIRKNVSLLGAGRESTFIAAVQIRPVSAVSAPDAINISNIQIGDGVNPDFIVSSETAASSGIYNTSMLLTGLWVCDARLGKSNISNANILFMANTEIIVEGTFNNIFNAEVISTYSPNFVISGNDAEPGASGSAMNFYMDLCAIYAGVSTSKGGGTQDPTLNTYGCNLGLVTVGANTIVNVRGGTSSGYTGSPATWSCTSPYTPATSGDWPTQPTTVDGALDILAQRATGGVTLGIFLYAGSAKGATVTSGSTFQTLSLAWGDTSSPGLVGPTHQVWSGNKRTTGNLGTDGYIQFFGSSLVSIGSTATSGYTLVLPQTQGGTFSLLTNNGLGFLSWTYPGSYNGYRTVTNAGATLNIQDRMIEITTGSTNQTLNVGWASAGNTGIQFSVIKIDSGVGSVTIQSPDLVNGVTNFTFSSQWEAHQFVANGIGFRVVT